MKKLTKLILILLSVTMLLAFLCQNVSAETNYYTATGSVSSLSEPLYGPAPSPSEGLNALEKAIYENIKAYATKAARGEISSSKFKITADISSLSWTKEELGCDIVSNGAISQAAQNALSKKLGEAIDFNYILKCLLADCPYEFFWYDKTIGASLGYNMSGTTKELHIAEMSASFYVASEYRSGNATDFKIDTAKIASANQALTYADQIVGKYKDKSDLEKLEGYRDEICALVSYNTAALENSLPYGNPWQLIYVFDNNSSTNVVCEGYAKAFKYLCDLSDFDKNIYCYLVSGLLEASGKSEGHMWNVLVIDGVNYLVDVTNYDYNNGRIDDMFLGGAKSSGDGAAHTLTNGFRYAYYTDQEDLFCEGYLILATSSYHEHRYSQEWSSDSSQHWHACSCGDKIDVEDHTPSSDGSCMQRTSCIVCGKRYGNFFSHNYNQQVVSDKHLKSEASCTEKAVYYYSCTCGSIGTTTFEYGDTLPHNFDQQKITSDYLASSNSCIAKAIYFYSCTCGEKGEVTFEYGKLGDHSFKNGVCSVCDATDPDYIPGEGPGEQPGEDNNGENPDNDPDNNPDNGSTDDSSDNTNEPDDKTDPDDDEGMDEIQEPKSLLELLIELIISIIVAIIKAIFGL